MSDWLDRNPAIGDIWFEFGTHADGSVDISDGTNDVFEHVRREHAEAIIALRAQFLADLRKVYGKMRAEGWKCAP